MNATLTPAAGVNDPGYKTRPFYWSVRRELWENRSLYLGPLIVAGFVLLGLLVQLHGLPERRRAALLLDSVKARHAIEMPYDAAIGMLVLAAFVIGAFYCLDALYGERRIAAFCSGNRSRSPTSPPSSQRSPSPSSCCR